MRKRRVLSYLLERRLKGRLHFTLLDPDKVTPREAAELAVLAGKAGSDSILVGGSLGVYEPQLSEVVESIKKACSLPVILFPGNINGLTPKADAVLFMVLLNSDDPYYLSGVQVQAAPLVASMGLEPIPSTYIIVGHGGAAGFIGRARPIPYERHEIIAAHVLAGAFTGSSIIYLEAGSGAPRPVPPEAVALSRKLLDKAGFKETLIVVGGGVRDPSTARDLARAGADALVTGTIVEEDPEKLAPLVEAFKSA
ncbi:geranylgeranylglyceryl/heptaprenylglyceryl phosphate synthase [Stetteria hydrogenophila]